ncbi:MAG: hypothetical protein WCK88_07570 [bacterium]
MDWYGLILAAFVVTGITAYALSLSFGSSSRIVLNSAPQESLALVAIAVANNVGTGASRASEIPVISTQDVVTAENAVVHDAMDGEVFFSDNFQQLSEYEEVAKIDIPTYLKGKMNKQDALENYIDQLTQHTEKAKATLQSITAQTLVHQSALQTVQTDIKNTQTKIEAAYKNRDSSGIMNSIADLDEFVLIQQDHKYGQIFGQQIVKEYQNVIQFSENKLQVIKANMPALVQ